MWTLLGTFLLGIVRWFIEKGNKKKMNDRQFVEFIEAHQKRRLGAGKSAIDARDALQETLDKMESEE